MEKITIHRLLSELKVLDDRIEKTITSISPLILKRTSGLLINSMGKSPVSETEFVDNANSGYQSATDLIKRKFKLRTALMRANGETKVNIGGVEYTIAEAIEMKSVINLKKSLLNHLKKQKSSLTDTFNRTVNKLEEDYERQLNSQISSLTNKSDISRVREEFRNAFYAINDVKLLDPLDISKKIEELENEITQFELEVDSALSEINAVTLVEIED